MEKYFKENWDASISLTVGWGALKVVVRRFCTQNFKERGKKQINDREAKMSRLTEIYPRLRLGSTSNNIGMKNRC